MTTFIFLRHGKSQANADNMIADNASPLTKEGEAQVRKAAHQLKKRYKITTIVSSPLLRARRTAEIIAKQLHYKKDIEIIDDLRERGFGQLEGRPKEHDSVWHYNVDGEFDVEPRGIVIARSEAALSKIKKLAESTEGEVLVIGHTVSGYYLQQVAAGKRYFEQFDPPKQLGNATPITVEILPVKSMPVQVRPRLLIYAAAIALGIALLVVGLIMIANRQTQQTGVKEQNIPLSPEDYNGDPNLQSAIQKQLQQQTEGNAQSDTGASGTLQPAQQGLQNSK
jgi:probable phosphoglycerate mutase